MDVAEKVLVVMCEVELIIGVYVKCF